MSRVLIVDDAKIARIQLKWILQRGGYEVIAEAENGENAIKAYSRHKPDLVTMDVSMPKMDGIEATARIIEKDPDAKIVMVTAAGTEEKVYAAIRSGAKNFIVKPFTPKVIRMLAKLSPPASPVEKATEEKKVDEDQKEKGDSAEKETKASAEKDAEPGSEENSETNAEKE